MPLIQSLEDRVAEAEENINILEKAPPQCELTTYEKFKE